MTTAIDRIRSKNKPVAKIESTPVAISAPTRSPTVADHPSPASTPTPPDPENAWPHSNVPPPIPCPLCDCPAIWSSIYEPNTFRCCDCDPPPGGWHFRTGGWQFVARRLLIVLDTIVTGMRFNHAVDGKPIGRVSNTRDQWGWESFPRTNWDEELRLARAEQQRSAAA